MPGFIGAACERLECPGEGNCNGHGRCMSLESFAEYSRSITLVLLKTIPLYIHSNFFQFNLGEPIRSNIHILLFGTEKLSMDVFVIQGIPPSIVQRNCVQSGMTP